MQTADIRPHTWANWDWFASQAKPILVSQIIDGRSATTIKLRALGLGWIVYAAGRHGGYRSSLFSLGLPSPDKPCWKDWNHFASHVCPVIQGYVDREGQPPSGQRLRREGHAWIVSAAQNYYGGYRAVLTKLGFQPPPLPQTGRGLGNPVIFCREFKRVAWMLCEKHRQTPSRQNFIDAGYWSLVCATHRNHSGFAHCLREAGLTLRPRQVRPKIGRWFRLADQLAFMQREFPALVALRVMPNVVILKRVCPSLVGYWTRRQVPWPSVADRFGFITWKVAAPQLTYVKAVDEALGFYEQHRRWPRAKECSEYLQAVRFNHRTTWEDALTRATLHRPVLSQLADRWRQHVLWIDRDQSLPVVTRRHCLNRIVIALNGFVALPHPSV